MARALLSGEVSSLCMTAKSAAKTERYVGQVIRAGFSQAGRVSLHPVRRLGHWRAGIVLLDYVTDEQTYSNLEQGSRRHHSMHIA